MLMIRRAVPRHIRRIGSRRVGRIVTIRSHPRSFIVTRSRGHHAHGCVGMVREGIGWLSVGWWVLGGFVSAPVFFFEGVVVHGGGVGVVASAGVCVLFVG